MNNLAYNDCISLTIYTHWHAFLTCKMGPGVGSLRATWKDDGYAALNRRDLAVWGQGDDDVATAKKKK